MQDAVVDGLPGLIYVVNGEVIQTVAFESDDGKIVAIYAVRNPDKLMHVSTPGARLN